MWTHEHTLGQRPDEAPSWRSGSVVNGPRVLVEHGDALTRDLLYHSLTEAGFDVRTCPGPTGSLGCPLLRQEQCPAVDGADVVVTGLLDRTLGRMIARRIRRHRDDVPMIAEATGRTLSGLDEIVDARIHPIRPNAVCDMVSFALDSRLVRTSTET